MENAFASKNTLINFYLLAPRQHFPAGSYHHSQAATKITHLPSMQNFLFFFTIYLPSRKGALGTEIDDYAISTPCFISI